MAVLAAADDGEVLLLLNLGDEAFRFPVDVSRFAVTETPDPGARPADPSLVPARSWAILGS
jgi:cyclomaltodextrinase / maltogenic alpha-amylase / neopullulanase